MIKSTPEGVAKIKTSLTDVIRSILVEASSLRGNEPVTSLISKCKESKVGPAEIFDLTSGFDRVEKTTIAKGAISRRDDFFSALATKSASALAEKISPYLFGLTINQVHVETGKNNYGVQANITLFSETRKLHIEFDLVPGPPPSKPERIFQINFQIKTSATISDLGMRNTDGRKEFSGKLVYAIEGSIVEFVTPLGRISANIELAKKEFEGDLADLFIH